MSNLLLKETVMKNKIVLCVVSIIVGLTLGCCSIGKDNIEFKEIRNVYKSVSPTIASIQKLSESDRKIAIAELVEKSSNCGFPLIEKDSLYDDYIFVTFIYVDSTHQHEIEFEVFGIYDEHRFGDRKLHRLDSTDIYHRSYMIPNDLCLSYRYILTDRAAGSKRIVTDPFNTNRIPAGAVEDYSWSALDLRADEEEWYSKRYESDSKLETLEITSRLLNNTRNIYVYLPPGYDNGCKGYPVIYLFDSFIYLNRIEVPNVLDNLIWENKIEPMVAVFIDNPTSTSRDYELPMNPVFRDFVVTELLPKIKSKYSITNRPEETIIGGMSYGGLAAAYIAFECDSVFGKVLSQSGGFWRDPEGKLKYADNDRTDFLINRFAKEDKRNIKLFLDWGLQEDMVLGANRKFVRILDRLDYDFKFIEFNGWHDWSNSRKIFPIGLQYLIEN